MVLRLTQSIYQDDHHRGDTEAGERSEDGDSESEARVPGTGGGGEVSEEAGIRGQEADQ